MTHGYDPKSCNALEKPFYRPVEAALRWCGLIAHEGEILSALHDGRDIPKTGQFPMWPCLQANTERILDAIANGDIQHGRDGRTVATGEPVRPDRVTVRHTDLKAWMAEHYPDQKPAFLFDEIERSTHSRITAVAWHALQAERDALKARIEKAEEWARGAIAERNRLTSQIEKITAEAAKANAPSPRSEAAYLNIIGALLDVITGRVPGFEKHPDIENETKLIEVIEHHFQGFNGLSKSNLSRKFPEAKRSLTAS